MSTNTWEQAVAPLCRRHAQALMAQEHLHMRHAHAQVHVCTRLPPRPSATHVRTHTNAHAHTHAQGDQAADEPLYCMATAMNFDDLQESRMINHRNSDTVALAAWKPGMLVLAFRGTASITCVDQCSASMCVVCLCDGWRAEVVMVACVCGVGWGGGGYFSTGRLDCLPFHLFRPILLCPGFSGMPRLTPRPGSWCTPTFSGATTPCVCRCWCTRVRLNVGAPTVGALRVNAALYRVRKQLCR